MPKHETSRRKFLVFNGYRAHLSTRCSRSIGCKLSKKKITRSEGYLEWINPAVLNQIKQRHRFQTRLFPLNLNYATCCKGEKTHPSCFTSNLSKAAWLQCERRRVRLFQLGSRGRAAFHSDAPYSAKTQGHCMVYKDAPAHSKYINQPVD